MTRLRWTLTLALCCTVLGACSNTEDPGDAHMPAAAKLFNSTGTELTPNLQLAQGATIRVEVRFFADDGDLLTGLDTEHYALLTFAPGSLVTVAPVAGQRFFFDLTAQSAPGTGTVMVGFGHDTLADEFSFGPFGVTVQ